jgi:zinc D-Ala-D-Ala carboxypeptidase
LVPSLTEDMNSNEPLETEKPVYIKEDEFACPCCGENKIDAGFITLLGAARESAGIPFIINSGYRCSEHNPTAGGSPTSSHMKGLACDIKATNSRNRHDILQALFRHRFNRIGVYKTFIHVDIDNTKAQDVVW